MKLCLTGNECSLLTIPHDDVRDVAHWLWRWVDGHGVNDGLLHYDVQRKTVPWATGRTQPSRWPVLHPDRNVCSRGMGYASTETSYHLELLRRHHRMTEQRQSQGTSFPTCGVR